MKERHVMELRKYVLGLVVKSTEHQLKVGLTDK